MGLQEFGEHGESKRKQSSPAVMNNNYNQLQPQGGGSVSVNLPVFLFQSPHSSNSNLYNSDQKDR